MRPLTRSGSLICGLIAEVCFAVLPLIVMLMVSLDLKEPQHWFASPEWSFGSAILFGQALVKLVAGLVRGGFDPGRVTLVFALCILFGLTPSFFLLHMVLRSEATCPYVKPALWIEVSQILWFAAGAVSYIVLAAVGEDRAASAEEPRDPNR
jgi:hypothetical protein